MVQIDKQLQGLSRLPRALARAEKATREAAFKGVDASSRAAQRAIRNDVDRVLSGGSLKLRAPGRRGRKVSNAVRRRLFDNRSRGAAAIIFNKFGRREGGRFLDFLAPYITGRDIRPRRARMLAIPLQKGGRRSKNRDPGNFPDLRAIEHQGQIYLIRQTRTRTLFMFLLVPRVKVRRRLHAAAIARREFAQLPGEVRRRFAFRGE